MKHLRHQAEPGTERRQQPSGPGRRGFLRQAGLAAIVVGGLETLGISQATAGTTAGPPESVPSSPRARTSGLSTRARANPDRTPRASWSSRTARAASRGTALLATAARDARTRSGAISGTTHAMANMVAPRAHGVIAQLTCSAFKPCNVHALTSAWVRTWPRRTTSQVRRVVRTLGQAGGAALRSVHQPVPDPQPTAEPVGFQNGTWVADLGVRRDRGPAAGSIVGF